MTTPAELRPHSKPPSRRELIAGVLVGPVLFSLLFMAVYFLAAAACQTGILLAGVLGLPLLIWLVILLSLATLAAIAVRARRLYRYWRRLQRPVRSRRFSASVRSDPRAVHRAFSAQGHVTNETPTGDNDVDEFLSLLAASLGLLFLLATVSLLIALLVLEPCEWMLAPTAWV